MKQTRRRVRWECFVRVPAECLWYGALAGIFGALAIILIDGGWDPPGRKYLALGGFVLIGLGWGAVGGVQNYLMLKKMYGEKWKEE